MLAIESLTVSYGLRSVLEGIDLQVGCGEVVALIGPNGAGKTTLIRAISGTLPWRSGAVRVDGRSVAALSPSQRASAMAVVAQASQLPRQFTVWDTVLIGRTPYLGWLGLPGEKDRQRVHWALQRTGLLDQAQRPLGELSGGEQQRVMLARALAQETPILLLDEPTSHLDLHHQSIILNHVKELARERGLAVLMALHDLNLAALYADRIGLLVDGQLRYCGAPAEVLTTENISGAYRIPVHIISHPDYGTPLVLPDGLLNPPSRAS